MFRAARRVSTNVSSKSSTRGLAWLMPIVALMGALGGCETATQWADPAASDQQPTSTEEMLANVPTLPEAVQRTAVACEATGPNTFSSFAAMSQALGDTSDGTTTYCVAPPCAIEQGGDAKRETVAVSFDLHSYYDTTTLDEPSLTVTGTLKGSTTSRALTKTYDRLTSVKVDELAHTIVVTVDGAEFGDITSATLSWASMGKNLGAGITSNEKSAAGDTADDVMGLCNCCAWDNCAIINGIWTCECTWWRSYCP